MKTWSIALMLGGAMLLLGPVWYYWPEIRQGIRLVEPQVITARVQLVNRCKIASSNFVVVNTRTGRRAQFSRGVARIEALKGTYLQLRLAGRFTGVTFNGEQQRATREMRMTAGCAQGERMRGVVDGLGGTFGGE